MSLAWLGRLWGHLGNVLIGFKPIAPSVNIMPHES